MPKRAPKYLARELRQKATLCEQILWEYVRNRRLGGYKITRQFPFTYIDSQEKEKFFIFDFYCHQAKLAIELDGKIHTQQSDYDKWRDATVALYGITTLRINNIDFINNYQGTLDLILNTLHSLSA